MIDPYVKVKHPVTGHWTREHRVVMEMAIGRPLRPDEIVHHINGDKRDNRLENLELTTRSEHAKTHIAEGTWGIGLPGPRPELHLPTIPCPVCAQPFKPYKRTPEERVQACSYSCSNALSPRGVASRNAKITHCPRGHAYTPENTHKSGGSRICRACAVEKQRARRARKRDAA